MTDKPTMAAVWEELSHEERELLTKMVNPNADQGSLALMKISTVLKAIAYRYMDHDVQAATQQANQQIIEQMRRQMQYEMQRMKEEYIHRQIAQVQQVRTTDNTYLESDWKKTFGF